MRLTHIIAQAAGELVGLTPGISIGLLVAIQIQLSDVKVKVNKMWEHFGLKDKE